MERSEGEEKGKMRLEREKRSNHLLKYKDYNIRICQPFGISTEDLIVVIDDVVGNLGNYYDHENLTDLVPLLLPPFLNPQNVFDPFKRLAETLNSVYFEWIEHGR